MYEFSSFLLFGTILCCLIYFRYWLKVTQHFNTEILHPIVIPANTVSVLIPFRNEVDHLPHLLESLPKCASFDHLKFYFINDHSTDLGTNVIENFINHTQIRNLFLIQLPSNVTGKKNAIRFGIDQIKTPWFQLLDADCIPNKFTFELMYAKAHKSKSKVILGPVGFELNHLNRAQSTSSSLYFALNKLIEWYQILENSALVALGFYHFYQKKPSMGNAANMLVNTEYFKQLNPYYNNNKIAGGDDIFLIESAFQKSQNDVDFLNTTQAAVNTKVLSHYSELFHQRIRWAKKTTVQSLNHTRNSQILLVLFLILHWVSLFYWGFYSYDFHYIFIIWGCKFVADMVILRKLLFAYNKKPSIGHILFSTWFQSIFIPVIAFAQFFSKVQWKDRKFPN